MYFFRERPEIEIELEDFIEEAYSSILVGERERRTKLEGVFKQAGGQIVSQSSHSITVLPKSGKANKTTYSKRDVAISQDSPTTRKLAKSLNVASEEKQQKANDQLRKSVNNEKKTRAI